MKIGEVKKKHAAALMRLPNVVGVFKGYRYKAGKRTNEECLLVYVEKKVEASTLKKGEAVPREIEGVKTDVIEKRGVRAPRPILHFATQVAPLALTQRERPSRCGNSLGHFNITAGTQGAVVRLSDGGLYVVTNNHVGADSNRGAIGDDILQPGPIDRGQQPRDTIADLSHVVEINFEGGGNGGCSIAKAVVAALNWGSKGLGHRTRVGIISIKQPSPNLVDVCLGKVIDPGFVSPETRHIGHVTKIAAAHLGDRVAKTGRTTERVDGDIEAEDGLISVSYGDAGTAMFDNQQAIRADSGSFSEGGDSGSAIHLIKDGEFAWCGLLFAGSDDGTTFANRIEDVIAYLPAFELA